MSSALDDAYQAPAFRQLGHQWVDRLADHLAELQRPGTSVPVLSQPRVSAEWMQLWRQRLTAASSSPAALLDAILAGSTQLQHPGYVGHQVSAPLPLATLCEWLSSFLNNGMAVFEMGPAASAIEQAVVRWMTGHLGWSDAADGAFVSGGSLANLMGLLAARQERAGFSVWRDGAHAGPALAALASEQAHYCSGRAVQLMGCGQAGLLTVKTDARFRLRPEELESSKALAERQGRKLIAVIASACSTATGSFDPIEPIADFCERHGLWLHVDGAHGASVVLSPAHRGLVAGIERADSVAWDAHKMLMMPALATGILFRDGSVARRLFAQQASYLFHDPESTSRDDVDPEHPMLPPHAYDLGQRTIECTKRLMAMPLYVCLATYGEAMFAEHVTASIDKARQFAGLLQTQPDFELLIEPQCNIVCFRFLPAHLRGADRMRLNRWQADVRARVLGRGAYYLVQTELDGIVYLRTTIIHPLTTPGHLEELLAELRRAGEELQSHPTLQG
jgi:L-2,4-diaminobutyrate decarboxylase